jgi:hypothetical protein
MGCGATQKAKAEVSPEEKKAMDKLRELFDRTASLHMGDRDSVKYSEFRAALNEDNELKDIMKAAGLNLDCKELTNVFVKMAGDDELISWTEFSDALLAGAITDQKAMSELKQVFDKAADSDKKDAKVNKEAFEKAIQDNARLKELMSAAGLNPDCTQMFSKMAGTDNLISWDEFCDHLKRGAVAEHKALAELRKIFDRTANLKEKNGKVNKEEFKTALDRDNALKESLIEAGLKLDDADLFKQLAGEDNLISWVEFRNALHNTPMFGHLYS